MIDVDIPKVRLNDYGTRFELTIKDAETGDVVNISSATTKQIIFKNKNGNKVTKYASFTTDGTDGKIYVDIQSGDLDTLGLWSYQGYIVTSSGSWHTETLYFYAEEVL